QLDYKNPALAKPVAVGQSETVSTLVAKAAQAGGLEIWADARIAKDEVDIFGEQATASELLRGLARAVCGTYRRVGGAYVLTSDLEGLATRGTRALAARALVKLDVQSKVAELRDQIRNQQLFDQVDFLPDDPFQAKTFLVTNRMPTSFYADPGWVSESVMNPSMRNAVPNVNAPGPVDSGFGPGKSQMIPDPALRDKIHLKVTIRYRFILPNGIVLDSEALDPFSNSMISVGPQVEKVTLPLDSSLLKLGSSAGYRSDDPDAVSRFCELAREHGIGEVWIETRRPQVIDAALASGLIIDLVLRPWQILPGERSEIDRTVLGQTGGQLNQIPTARLDLAADQSYFFADSFSPAVDLPDHWTRLLGLASKRGIHRLILMDPIPEGYRHSDSTDYERISQGQEISNGVPVPKNLRDLVPNIGEFGYTTSLRLTCLRKFGVDPIDLEHPFRRGPYSPIPYFGEGQMGQFEYPRMRFGENDELTAFVMIERMRNDLALSALKKAVDRLAEAGHPIWLQYESYLHERHRSPLEFGPSSALTDRFSQERDSSEMITINPLTAEDSSGAWVFSIRCVLDKPMCFDFSDVKLARLPVYFDRVFRKAKN
ncbi:MAG: hypothetical protein P4L46_22005, partial [Fimbriimonas sp.]|nr:hypothetical protein [Fimbriimonas sp.]